MCLHKEPTEADRTECPPWGRHWGSQGDAIQGAAAEVGRGKTCRGQTE